MVHRRRVTEAMGGWRHYRDLRTSPDVELWRRAQAHGYALTFVPRLTGIKFPAGSRRGVYRTRPSHQQSTWLARIDAEPDLEVRLLVDLAVGRNGDGWGGLSFREMIGSLWRQTQRRFQVRRRLPVLGLSSPHGHVIDTLRRYKGL
jgi:hypothetical protein